MAGNDPPRHVTHGLQCSNAREDGFIAAANRHDFDATASYVTDDGVLVDHPEGTRDQGKEAIKTWLRRDEEEFSSDCRLTILDTIETADRSAVRRPDRDP